ncbi:MAG: Mur ligase family protein [Candidatus Paceibacterales bacterium]
MVRIKMMKEFIKKFIPSFLLSWYHFLLAFLGALIFGFPSRLRQGFGLRLDGVGLRPDEVGGQAKKLKIIGVTGTNGKSTTVEMVSKILETAGYKVAALSSIKFKIRDKEWPNELRMTMPGRFILQRFLRQAEDADCQYVVLEVTSEGIKQHRHQFIDFEVAVFTNLSPEHIEAHGSFEKYREAKGKLFQATKKVHILNLDDKNTGYFLKFPAEKKYLFKTKNQKPKTKNQNLEILEAENIKIKTGGVDFKIQEVPFHLNLIGGFNVDNALAAISVAKSQNISLEICKKALERIEGMPGRMEIVIAEPFKVIVDYAFTPNALEKVYQIIQETRNKRQETRMICVLGSCGGGRDKWKRPILGKLAGEYCDEVIVTNEDPYDEDPMEIINQVASGAGEKAKKILDRRGAIREALEIAKPEDVVIITGKGCEPSIWITGSKSISWDDREVVKEEFKRLS